MRGEIVSTEKQIAALQERLAMARQYRENRHHQNESQRILYDSAVRHLSELKASGVEIAPKKWQAEVERLSVQKDGQYQQMRSMRKNIQAVERLKKSAVEIAKHRIHEPER